MLRFFDAHTHAQFAAFKDDYREVIKRALDNGVGLINVGTQKDTSRRAVKIAHEFSAKDELSPIGGNCVFATVGLHPIHTSKSYYDPEELGAALKWGEPRLDGFWSRREEFDYDYYKNLALDSKVVAIGECGLDYAVFVREQRERLQKRVPADLAFVTKATSVADAPKFWQWSAKEAALSEGGFSQEEIERIKEKQKEAFAKQIELAYEVKKSLMIHCRDAYTDLIELLTTHYKLLTDPPGIIHFFSGTINEAKQLLDLGFYFTFGGAITYLPKKNGTKYAEIISMMPMERILSETDAPYVAPVPYRGKRNEPAYVIEVVKKLAEIKNAPLEVIREQILENAKDAFGIEF